MDCNSVRMLLPFLERPGELPAAEVAWLEQHLASCPLCRDLAARERAFDESVARALMDVAIPGSLREQVGASLSEQDRRGRRGKVLRGAGLASLAAALLVALSFVLGWWSPRVTVTADQLLQDDFGDFQYVLNRNVESAEAFFLGRGIKTELPRELDYSLLTDLEVSNFKGHEVARLDFQIGTDRARVYVLPKKQFSLPNANPALSVASGSECQIEIVDGSRDFIYVWVLLGTNVKRQMFMSKTLVG